MSNRPSDSGDSKPDFSFLDRPAPDADSDIDPVPEPAESAAAEPLQPVVPEPAAPPAAASSNPRPAKRSAEPKPDPVTAPSRRPAQTGAAQQTESAGTAGSSDRFFRLLVGYAAAVTLLLAGLLVTGRISLSGSHNLESLPDVRPLRDNEFQLVPADAELPDQHVLQLGESRRFGDVVVTPLKVTREPLDFVSMTTGQTAADRTTREVLKLWLQFENVSQQVAFPPWDISLMAHRSPAYGTDSDTVANSWLSVTDSSADNPVRILNYPHFPDSSFDLAGMASGQLLSPGQTLTSFVASSDDDRQFSPEATSYRWRVQIRKGINTTSKQGVTTLIDVVFSPTQILEPDPA